MSVISKEQVSSEETVAFPVFVLIHQDIPNYYFPSLGNTGGGRSGLLSGKTNLNELALTEIRAAVRQSLALEVPTEINPNDISYPWHGASVAKMFVQIKKKDVFEDHKVQLNGNNIPYLLYREVASLATECGASFEQALQFMLEKAVEELRNEQKQFQMAKVLKHMVDKEQADTTE